MPKNIFKTNFTLISVLSHLQNIQTILSFNDTRSQQVKRDNMNLIKTSQVSIVEFLKYVSDGQEHLSEIIERKKSNCQKKRTKYWITKKSQSQRKQIPTTRAQNKPMKHSVGFVHNDSIFETKFDNEGTITTEHSNIRLFDDEAEPQN